MVEVNREGPRLLHQVVTEVCGSPAARTGRLVNQNDCRRKVNFASEGQRKVGQRNRASGRGSGKTVHIMVLLGSTSDELGVKRREWRIERGLCGATIEGNSERLASIFNLCERHGAVKQQGGCCCARFSVAVYLQCVVWPKSERTQSEQRLNP